MRKDVSELNEAFNEAKDSIAQRDTVSLINILESYPDLIDYRDRYGETLIFHAIYHCQSSILSLLLSKGARVGVENCAGWDPVFVALHEHDENFLKQLIEKLNPAEAEFLISKKHPFSGQCFIDELEKISPSLLMIFSKKMHQKQKDLSQRSLDWAQKESNPSWISFDVSATGR